jgi:hypothetical protein
MTKGKDGESTANSKGKRFVYIFEKTSVSG